MHEKFRKLYHNITVCSLCSLMGKSRTKQKSLISTPLFPSPLLILPLWLVPFFFPSSLSCRVRVQLGDKGIETGSSVLLCQTIWLYTAVISPLYLSPGTGLCDELEQESSLRARVFVCVCVCVQRCSPSELVDPVLPSCMWDSQQRHPCTHTILALLSFCNFQPSAPG